MSCTEFDLRDYFFGELPEAERLRAANHVTACRNCTRELDHLRHLRMALESVPDAEPPQRIGFVSDKIFEPSRARRLWKGFWHSAPRLGFASAAMLSAALIVFSFRPPLAVRSVEKPVPVAVASSGAASSGAAVSGVAGFDAANPGPELQRSIDAAVQRAVLETEARLQRRTEALLAASDRKHEQNRRALMLSVADSFTMLQKRMMFSRASLVNYGNDSRSDAQ